MAVASIRRGPRVPLDQRRDSIELFAAEEQFQIAWRELRAEALATRDRQLLARLDGFVGAFRSWLEAWEANGRQ